MTRQLSPKLKIYKRFDTDLWGFLAISEKPSKALKHVYDCYSNNRKIKKILKKRKFFIKKKRRIRFNYQLNEPLVQIKRKRVTMKNSLYLDKLKLKKFYGNIKQIKFKNNFKIFKKQIIILGTSFGFILEKRIDIIFYRANFFKSIHEARQYISHNKIIINGKKMKASKISVNLNDIISLNEPLMQKKYFYLKLKEKLKKRKILANYPSYLEVNYKIFSVIFHKLPKNNEIPYPFDIDLDKMTYNYLK